MATDAEDIFAQYPPASWTVGGQTWVFPVQRITGEVANRLVKRERPYRDGHKVDDTGSKGDEWTFECHFDNTLLGSAYDQNGAPLYPDVLNAIAASFHVHECGDLVVPTEGRVRARAETLSRVEASDVRDGAVVTLKFTADNEDSVDAAALKPPSVHASAVYLLTATVFSAEESGAWDGGSLAALNGLVNELVGIANTPDAMAGELADRARIVRHNVEKLQRTFSQKNAEGRDLLLDPAHSRLQRQLLRLAGLAASAEGEAARRRRQITTRRFGADMSLAGIAGMLGQSFDELLMLNQGHVEDPGLVLAGTPVRIYV